MHATLFLSLGISLMGPSADEPKPGTRPPQLAQLEANFASRVTGLAASVQTPEQAAAVRGLWVMDAGTSRIRTLHAQRVTQEQPSLLRGLVPAHRPVDLPGAKVVDTPPAINPFLPASTGKVRVPSATRIER
jgi:hypothetical protein